MEVVKKALKLLTFPAIQKGGRFSAITLPGFNSSDSTVVSPAILAAI